MAVSRWLATGLAVWCTLALAACQGQTLPEWPDPADDKALALLADRTLEAGLPEQDRSALLFLWGQELAARARSGEPAKAAAWREAAIGAFLRVVDAGTPPELVADSRINLELLWREQAQQQQQQQSGGNSQEQPDKQQDSQDGSQDQPGAKDRQQGGQSGKDGQKGQPEGQQEQQGGLNGKTGQDQPGQKPADPAGQNQQQSAQAGGPRDLSGLVRDKPGDTRVDQALAAEAERRARTEAQARNQYETSGGMTAVEQDW